MSNQGPNFTARPTLRIDLSAVKANYRALQKQVGQVKVAACVKANAYGLGAERIGRSLYGAGCRNFFVATAGEGKSLREAIGDNASIYVLNGPAPRDLTLFFGSNLKPVINSMVQARIWANATRDVKRAPFSALHIDTGINRLGFPIDEFEKLIANKSLLGAIGADLVMSHLACAPDAEHPLNAEQLSRFRKSASRLKVMPMSLANSAGIYLGSQYHFQMVRPGVSLFAQQATLNPSQEVTKPVVSLMAPVLQIRKVPAGATIGYNASYETQQDSVIATVAAGYADGIPLSSSSDQGNPRGFATIQGKRAPIVGRVSMDLTTLDVTNIKKTPRIGDWVEFRGDMLEADARDCGTHNYELLSNLSRRCQLHFVG